MFHNGEDMSCDVNLDYCITRPNTLALTTLLIWSYNYSLYGPETHIWDNSPDASLKMNMKVKSEYVPIETFQQHLKKMYRYLKVKENLDVFTHHQQLKEKARLLRNIPNTNHLAGMMLFMRDMFHGCYWELGREFSNLFDNCLERSIGREKAVCEHMYETWSVVVPSCKNNENKQNSQTFYNADFINTNNTHIWTCKLAAYHEI